ncbi:oxygenase MpaB family protein [Pengzhenrongella sicca]|uniref:DUF2236 domain-containing protein n=1 Tax=Pengzhenrongella sicca TaxID=2819238 RepID=A0A8A4ZEA2_9MICO|nr:oxygenase MpaB family protein [Pengzhenrongella sicca]QTE28876.1 DUF2236 domain-containing protein [Pengzhenrongella sicca]
MADVTTLDPGLVERVRQRAGAALFARVAGDRGPAQRERIHHRPGPRWFATDSAICRVHGDASMFVGGLRALLLQSLHPGAMAAVAAHSGYLGDPWGRLERTSTFLAMTTFGAADDAAAVIAHVRSVHERISGVTPEGLAYAASDPHLLRWVHVAEADSFLAAHQRYGAEPLDRAGCDRYVAEVAVVGERLGVIDPPRTRAELAAQLEAYRPELAATPAAREAARFILLRPPVPWLALGPYTALTGAAVGLLPRWARRPLALPYLPPVDATLGRAGGHAITAAIRWAMAPTA